MKCKNLGTILIATCLLLTGCGNGTGNNGDENNSQDPITLDWYINYSWFVTGWGENLVSKTITEETGVSVNFITPVGNEEEKLNALIASDSLPDMITLGWWESQVEEMINNDMVYALNELADQYDPYFYEVTDTDVINWYEREDGNIYCYPNSSYTPKDVETYDNIPSNQCFMVRKDIYEAIGSPDMTTPDGFYNAIKDAAELFPEEDGRPIIPIGGTGFDEMGCKSFDQYLQNFLAIKFEEEGKYYDRNTDPEYLKWLKVFRKLNEEGYISPDTFVDQRTQISEKIGQARYFCMFYQSTDMADQEKLLYAKNPEKIYIAVEGPRNEKGDDPILATTGITGWTVTLISKNCKDPERAIKFMDYLMSEHGQKLISLGVEGVTYDMVDGVAVIRPDVEEMLNTDRLSYDNIYGADDAYWMLQDNVMQRQWLPATKEPMKQLEEWTYPYATYTGQYEIMMVESGELGRSFSRTNKLWSQTLKQLILAESDEKFDEILQEYCKTRSEMGYEALMEQETIQMNLNKEKLGIK